MPIIKTGSFNLTVDAVVFTILNKELKILLIKRKKEPFKDKFALPGGFINIDEDIEEAVKRELEEETGARDIYLKQLKAFGNLGRDPRGRIVTVAFLALIDSETVILNAGGDAALARWHPVKTLSELAFDHRKIVDFALESLRNELEKTNIACEILPNRFTLTEMQNAYEIILGKKIDKRNFRKKIKESGIVKPLRQSKMDGAHRPAQLYSFKNAILKL